MKTREPSSHPALGILAGRGPLPVCVAQAARDQGRNVFVIATPGETDPGVRDFPHAWVRLGRLGKSVRLLKKAGVRDIVMIGPASRPALTSLRLDWAGLRFLPRFMELLRQGDDALLSGLVHYFEQEHGFRFIPAESIMPTLEAGAGVWTKRQPAKADYEDIEKAARILRATGPFDIGQGAVVVRGMVLALEAAEGTDLMLERLLALDPRLRGTQHRRAGVLVKLPKEQQDRRVDLPTIGVNTVLNAARAGLAGIVVEAQGALVADLEAAVEQANRENMFLFVRSKDMP